jgi:hypothetical protein
MEDWKERLVAEHQELTERIRKLDRFINNPETFCETSPIQGSLLIAQLAAMNAYQCILGQRMIHHSIIMPSE